ncbi:YlqD family protein [Alicyclobacillus tolerans]|uniref:YlqD family protein n=1 Tax=Alicyclobacillus tolerans TaxID=90970 RepID=UPI001F297319|nr:YlqD family protein [Alicyclobacillus tolerans]MCF8564387.1 YlqD family protein [Alicyclobacillus tolerans]
MFTIRQPVAVKFILTDLTKQQILNEQRSQIERLTFELEQLDQQGAQAIEQAMAQSSEAAEQVRAQLEQEKSNRVEQREQLIQQIQQIQQMELGSEIQNMTVETSVEVRVGDDWGKILQGAEIVIKDGRVHELRRGGDPVVE